MGDSLKEMAQLVRVHYLFGRSAAQQAGLLSDPEAGLPPVKAAELMHAAIDRYFLCPSSMLAILFKAHLLFCVLSEMGFLSGGTLHSQSGRGNRNWKKLLEDL